MAPARVYRTVPSLLTFCVFQVKYWIISPVTVNRNGSIKCPYQTWALHGFNLWHFFVAYPGEYRYIITLISNTPLAGGQAEQNGKLC